MEIGLVERDLRWYPKAIPLLSESMYLLWHPSREKIYTSLLHNIRTQLSEAAFEPAWAKGQAMDMQKAIEYALEL
jgi:hypothetical protein